MATPQIVSFYNGTWSVPDAYVTTQPSNQMLNIATTGITGGNWLIAMVGWHEVPQLPMTVSVGDDAGNLWTPIVTSPSTPVSEASLLNQNATFQYGTTTPWTVSNGTLTASTVETLGNNAFSGQIVNNGVGATVSITSNHVSIASFSPNLVTGTAYVWLTNTSSSVHVDLNWYNSGGSLISTTTGANTTVPAKTWTNLVNISTPPSAAVTAAVVVSLGGTPSAANVWYVSNAGIQYTDILNMNPYFAQTPALSHWTSAGATLSPSTGETFNNMPSVHISPSGTSSQVSLMTGASSLVSIVANNFYTANGYLYSPAGYYYTNLTLRWYNSGSTLLTSTVSNNFFIPPGEWTQVTVAGQAPSNAAFAGIAMIMQGSPKPWDIMYAAQMTLSPSQGYSSVCRSTIWAAPNIASSTTQVSISPLGQATALSAIVWQVSNLPTWLEVDTTGANLINQSSTLPLTFTPSQSDFVVSTCAADLSQQWTLDQVDLNGWDKIHNSEPGTNNISSEGDIFLRSRGIVSTSGSNSALFYDVNPLNNNPVFAASVSGWSTNNSTLVSSTAFTWPNNGIDPRLSSQKSALWTPNGTSSTVNAYVSIANAPAVTPGLRYIGDAYLSSSVGWSTYSLTLLWLNSSHVQISANTSATFAVPANSWTNNYIAATAPAGAAFASVVVNQTGTPPASAFTYIGRGTITQANNNGLGLGGCVAAFRLSPQHIPAVVNSNWPYLKLEAAFGYPSSTPPDQLQYVDISNRLLSATIKRGRQYELNSLEAGEIDFVLRNDDGFLTPSNPNGPYKIQSYTPIRVTAIWQGKIYPVFIGYMERWPETWSDPHWGEINAVGVDSWAMFVGISPSVVKGERLVDYPFGYWPCGDGNSSTTAVNIGLSGNTTPLTAVAAPDGVGASKASFGDNTIKLVGDSGTNWVLAGLLSSQGSQGYALTYNGPPLPPINEGVAVTWWVYVSSTGPASVQTRTAIFTAVGLSGPIIQVWMTNSGELNVTTWSTTGVQTDHTPSAFNYFNQSIPMLLNFNSTGFTLYIGNAAIITGTDTMATYWSFFTMCGRYDLYTYGFFANMAISHVAVYPRQLGFSRVVTYNYTGLDALAGDFGDWRVSRLMSYMLWTVPHRVYYDVSTSQLSGATDISGQDFGSAINNVANTERALMFIDKAGYFTYRTRDHALDRGIQAVFGENTAAGEIPYLVNVELDFDPQYVYNDFQVTHKGTPAFNQTSVSSPIIYNKNLTSINQYGDRSQQLTSYFSSITQSVDLANWLTNQYSQPQPRVQQINCIPMADPTLFAKLLELDIGDRVTVNRRPVGAPLISLDVTIIGVHHDIDWKNGKWMVTFDMMPTVIAALTVKSLTLNDPVLGKLDSGNVIGW